MRPAAGTCLLCLSAAGCRDVPFVSICRRLQGLAFCQSAAGCRLAAVTPFVSVRGRLQGRAFCVCTRPAAGTCLLCLSAAGCRDVPFVCLRPAAGTCLLSVCGRLQGRAFCVCMRPAARDMPFVSVGEAGCRDVPFACLYEAGCRDVPFVCLCSRLAGTCLLSVCMRPAGRDVPFVSVCAAGWQGRAFSVSV